MSLPGSWIFPVRSVKRNSPRLRRSVVSRSGVRFSTTPTFSMKPAFSMTPTMAPEIAAIRWFNSEPLTLSALRGRVVLLHAFQMLCPGCVSHGTPQAKNLVVRHLEDQFVVHLQQHARRSAFWPRAAPSMRIMARRMMSAAVPCRAR
jgi:hypothetical protein